MVCATHSTQEVFDKIMPCTYTNYFFLDTPMTKAFRNAQVHISTLGTININNDLTIDQKHEFVHEVLGPALYQFSSGSYYSESEYSMTKGQWQERFWEPETYQRLLQVKQTWDPEHVFSCRHCIGHEEMELEISERTLPSWRFSDEL